MIEKKKTITRGRKFDQVIEGARGVFMREGYEGASVDDIARAAGVSKATLYSYFPDKEVMYKAVFRAELLRERIDCSAVGDLDLPMAQVLRFTGHLIASHLTSDFGICMLRMSIAEAARFPDLAKEYYEIGPKALLEALVGRFRQWQHDGMLRQDLADLDLVADSFVHLNSARVKDRVMLMGRRAVDDDMIRDTVSNAVEVFLRAYGTPAAQGAASHEADVTTP